MGWIIDMSERGGDVRRFDEGLKRAKSGLMEVCDIWEDMKQDFQMRGSYGERYGSYGERYGERNSYDERGDYYRRDYPMHHMSERDWHELQERRRRDSMGRYM